MCKRQAGEKLLEEEKGLEGLIDDIGEDHAKLILDRLELLSKLREIVKNPKLDERLKHCENNLDTPDWWESGKHDRELIRAVLKYGLYRSDQFILNDPEFPFAEAERNYVRSLEVLKSLKFDNPADLFKLAMGEIPKKSEKKEETSTTTESTTKPSTSPSKKSDETAETKDNIAVDKETVEVDEKAKEVTTSDECESEKKLNEDSPGEKSTEEIVSTDEKVSTAEEEEVKSLDEKSSEEKEQEKEKPEETDEKVEKMEVEESVPVSGEISTKDSTTNEKMEVDEEKPKTPVTDETPEEVSPTEEKPLEAVEKDEKDSEKTEVENQDKSSDEKTEEENKSTVEVVEKEAEKEEILQADEEKPEPKIDDEKSSTETIEKSESPEKTVDEIVEDPEKIIKPEDIKTEPGIERTGEPKVIDTVVIDDDDTLPEKTTDSSVKKSTEETTRTPQFPDLEPLMKMKHFDAMLMKGDMKDSLKSLSRVFDTSMVVKWFRDFALEKRISHIIYCVEKGTWPVGKSYSAYSGCLGIDLDLPLHETVKRINSVDDKRSSSNTPESSLTALESQLRHSSSEFMGALTKQSKKGQKRHIAIDVETERAKLHALLNNSTPMGANAKANWHEDEQDLRRTGQSLQPPPAHQPSARSLDRYKPSVTIPGTSSTLTPIDLSSR
jgi:chromodomain-helicase-DNA-binding protein 7